MSDESRYPPHCQMMRQSLRTKDWQQDVIAAVMDQSRSTVNAILTGRQTLTARLALNYGALLNLSPEVLLKAQNAWFVSVLPRNEEMLAAIRQRAATADARVVGNTQAEIDSLSKERAAIDKRIARLMSRLQTANQPEPKGTAV